MSTTPTLSQRRAAHALACIKKRETDGKQTYGNYVAYVSALPATILMNGLGQAAATLLSQKSTTGHGELYNDLQSWLCGNDEATPFRNKQNLLDAIITAEPADYFHAQTEALAYLVWLKKMAKAFLEQERTPHKQGDEQS
ncbi:MAG: type III-B CRISPR module-associated protein Cmr5 [Opitutaceae bacterium]|jgi:CRISPR-associated protein Cmr5|nr:type III-B CRISPR module-associated protein Cmr5 [Opitutaceae bacterium]